MAKKRRKTSKRFLSLLKHTLGFYLQHKFNLNLENSEIVGLKPPYVLLANHTNFWDPFLLSYFIPEPVYYVASDEYFRNPILKFLLRLVGAIPKSKFVSDSSAVMDILRVKRSGGVIGIFPEGYRNWDGRTSEVIFTTAKLIRSLRIPVITAVLQGAHLSFPRWARKSRRGRITVRFELTLTPKQIASMNADEIYRTVCDGLAYDDLDFEKKSRVRFEGKALAEDLELYLFTCPSCRALCSLVSEGDELTCNSCGFTVRYGSDGFLSAVRGESGFRTPGEWNSWQEAYLREILRSREIPGTGDPVFEDRNVTLKRGRRLIPLKKINFGRIRLFKDRIEFMSLRRQKTDFYIDRIVGINVQHNNQFEFYHDNLLYRFSFRSGKISAYKWVTAIRLIRDMAGTPILTD
jgi:1-acyl-sn-glycerol-3-phosphate acyltransferase